MSTADIVIIGVVALVVALIMFRMYKRKKAGKGVSCDCSSCPTGCSAKKINK